MEVLLWQDIKHLGKRGEIVKVAEGYARNYLFPKKLATLSTPTNQRELEYEKKRLVKQKEKRKVTLQALASQIEKSSCTLEVRANEEGVLYGSVTPQMIVNALNQEGLKNIEPEMIDLETSIKELGVYRIKIKLHPEISTECRLWVVEETTPGSDEKASKSSS